MKNLILIAVLSLLAFGGCIEKKELRLLIAIDPSEVNDWNYTAMTNSLKEYIHKNYYDKAVVKPLRLFVETNLFPSVALNPFGYLAQNADPSEWTILFAVKPFTNTMNRRLEYEILLCNSKSQSNQRETHPYALASPLNALVDIEKQLTDNPSNFLKILHYNANKTIVLIVADTNSGIRWKDDPMLKATRDFIKKKIQGEVDLVSTQINTGFFYIKRNPSEWVRSISGLAYKNYYLMAFHPYYDEEKQTDVYEAFFANALSSAEDEVLMTKTLFKPQTLLSQIDSLFKNNSLSKPQRQYFWKGKTENPQTIHSLCFQYKPYTALKPEPNEPLYLLIESLGEINPTATYPVPMILTSNRQYHNRFIPERSLAVRDLMKHLNERSALSLFMDKGGNIIRKMVFFEYVTTGDIYIRILFGPVDEQSHEKWREELSKFGISVHNKLFYPSDFR